MDLTDDPSGAGMELAQIMASGPEWQQAKEELRPQLRPDMSQDEVVAAGIAALANAGIGSEAIIAGIPDSYRAQLSPEVQEQMGRAFDLYMTASLVKDLIDGTPLPVMSIARGMVRVEAHEVDGAVFNVVHAMATPLDDPELMIAEFAEACYRTFPGPVFGRFIENVRDAEWWRKHKEGEPYRGIALDDPRSGLAPEAKLEPQEYADEVRRATDRVRRAVKRFSARWTAKADALSKERG